MALSPDNESFLSPDSRIDFLKSLPSLPVRERNGHKGTYGTSAILGGSYGMSGAVILAGSAALVAGSGLVRLFIPDRILPIVAAGKPEAMTTPLRSDVKGRISQEEADHLTEILPTTSSVGIGPGLGRSLGLELLVTRLFQELPNPTVIDADALNALSAREIFLPPSHRSVFTDVPPSQPAGPRILTPHPGEFARMRGRKISSDPSERQEAAVDFLRVFRKETLPLDGPNAPETILVLKGAGTVVTDGARVFLNKTGNPGMGTGGSGDVLTGIITAFLATGLSPWDAAVLGVALHGLAGDLAAEKIGMESLNAGDIIRSLPDAIRLFRQAKQEGEEWTGSGPENEGGEE